MSDDRSSPSALVFARLLGSGPMARVALEAALGELASPAFITSEKGTVLHANAAARERLAKARASVQKRLAAAVKRVGESSRELFVTPLRCEGQPPYFLVVFRPRDEKSSPVDYAASLWELTPRQREVLALLAQGFGNKTIAARLGCTERTVETHLTAIFQKSGIDGRTALLAALMRG